MRNSAVIEELQLPKVKDILISFATPKTPKQVENELEIEKLKLQTLLEKHYLKVLNPEARKGRLYVLTNKAYKLLKLSNSFNKHTLDWDIQGWIIASPRQRLVVLKTLDFVKRTSEDIRMRVSRYNPKFTRISIKRVLGELVEKKLLDTYLKKGKRYYWINKHGLHVRDTIISLQESK